MCGRFVQVSSPELLAERFQADLRTTDGFEGPSYNVTPRSHVPVVRERVYDGGEHERVLSALRWGLIPSWAKDPKIGDRLINARAETIATKPSYRRAFAKRRCLIPADGFYEWQPQSGERRKQPMFIRARDGEPLAFAGLWEAWLDPSHPDDDDAWLRTCVIITTAANTTLKAIHDRMPVIVPESKWAEWLDPTVEKTEALGRLLVPADEGVLDVYPVAPLVNNTRNNGPELVARLAA